MDNFKALTGADIFDGEKRHTGMVLMIVGDTCLGIAKPGVLPVDSKRITLEGGLLVPGFVDLQVNGGGGVQFNAQPDTAAITTICAAHARFGTTALLPTLITDTPQITRKAIEACTEAALANVPGFLGLHLEGPHLSTARKGAHDPDLIRAMSDDDLAGLRDASARLPHLMITVAPETVSRKQIRALSQCGIRVSLGHSAATFKCAQSAAKAGAVAVTHLYNAMSPLGHREPGLVGAALDTGILSAGIIADGIHVDIAALALAVRAKRGPGKIFLVTDAMASLGTDMTQMTLNGRTILRKNGRLSLADGTLAGADLDMISAVRLMAGPVGIGLEEALRMASLYPARIIGEKRRGYLKSGAAADIVHLDDALSVQNVWIGGQKIALD